jgi:serine/threonine protein kinase
MSMIGRALGNFECTALLGMGGMGEVYRAKDRKLGRDVAIKVLPEEFTEGTAGVPLKINIVLNWLEEVKERVSVE